MSVIRLFLFACAAVALVLKAEAKSLSNKIIGGEPVPIEKFKYQVYVAALIEKQTIMGTTTYLGNCGGSIISENFVLTAAHCTMDLKPEQFIVCAGQSSKTLCFQSGLTKTVRHIYEHDKFVSERDYWGNEKVDYDVALLQLAQPLVYSSAIGPIPLPSMGAVLPANQWAVTSGWGNTIVGQEVLSDVLKAVQVRVLDKAQCRENSNAFSERMLCAEEKTGGGDSGGPLVFNGQLFGITSFGSNGLDYFTSVPAVRDFIHRVARV